MRARSRRRSRSVTAEPISCRPPPGGGPGMVVVSGPGEPRSSGLREDRREQQEKTLPAWPHEPPAHSQRSSHTRTRTPQRRLFHTTKEDSSRADARSVEEATRQRDGRRYTEGPGRSADGSEVAAGQLDRIGDDRRSSGAGSCRARWRRRAEPSASPSCAAQGGPVVDPSPPSRRTAPASRSSSPEPWPSQRLADHLVDPAAAATGAVAVSPVSSTAEPEPAQLGHGRGAEP